MARTPLALQQLRGVAEHPRFGEVPAPDRVALVSAPLGRPLRAHQRPEHQGPVRQRPLRLSLCRPRWAARRPARAATASSATTRTTCRKPNRIRSARATIDWLDVVMSTRVNDPRTAAKVVVMQRCHQQDLSGHLLEQGGWEHLCLPAEYERPDARDFDRLVRPAQRSRANCCGPSGSARRKSKIAESAASAATPPPGQLQQRPSPAGGGIFKRHWFRYWQPRGANLPPVVVRLPDGTQMSIAAIEAPHGSMSRSSPGIARSRIWTPRTTWSAKYGAGWAPIFLLGDQVRGRMDCPATVKAVRELTAEMAATLSPN